MLHYEVEVASYFTFGIVRAPFHHSALDRRDLDVLRALPISMPEQTVSRPIRERSEASWNRVRPMRKYSSNIAPRIWHLDTEYQRGEPTRSASSSVRIRSVTFRSPEAFHFTLRFYKYLFFVLISRPSNNISVVLPRANGNCRESRIWRV